MNSPKDRFQLFAALVLLVLLCFIVWYGLFYLQGAEHSPEGTLVYREAGRLVNV